MNSLLGGCCSLAVIVDSSPFVAKKWPGLHATETVRLMCSTGMENAGFCRWSSIKECFSVPFS